MTPRPSAKFLWDARRAAERITAGRDFTGYVADELLRSAVERQFEIIGEAFASLRRVDPAMAASIPHLARIIAFRNVLIHGYASVNNRPVWTVVEAELPRLLWLLARLLDEAV